MGFSSLWGGALFGLSNVCRGEFVSGDAEASWGTIFSTIFSCWVAFVLSCFALDIWRRRQEARQI
jgi:hypothetical protein